MGMGQFRFFISYIFAVVSFPLLPLWPKYGLKPLPFATLYMNWSSPKTSVGKKDWISLLSPFQTYFKHKTLLGTLKNLFSRMPVEQSWHFSKFHTSMSFKGTPRLGETMENKAWKWVSFSREKMGVWAQFRFRNHPPALRLLSPQLGLQRDPGPLQPELER